MGNINKGMKRYSLLILLFFLVSMQLAAESNPACIPTERTDWSKSYSDYLRDKYPDKKSKEILFLGDSITQLWGFSKDNKNPGGLEVWDKIFMPLHAANFGVSGDRNEDLLWRITEGRQLEQFNPKVVVLLIGTNNMNGPKADKPEEIAEAIKLILDTLRQKLPGAKILLLGLTPRFDNYNSPEYFKLNIDAVNKRISKYDDGKIIFYLDAAKSFTNDDGTIKKELYNDGIHLTPNGYEVFSMVILPKIKELLSETQQDPLK